MLLQLYFVSWNSICFCDAWNILNYCHGLETEVQESLRCSVHVITFWVITLLAVHCCNIYCQLKVLQGILQQLRLCGFSYYNHEHAIPYEILCKIQLWWPCNQCYDAIWNFLFWSAPLLLPFLLCTSNDFFSSPTLHNQSVGFCSHGHPW